MRKQDCCTQVEGHSKVQNVREMFLLTVSSELLSLNKLGMFRHDCELECYVKRLVRCLQCQGHCEGSQNRNMTFYYVF